jgi:predicted kinase
MEAIIFIIQAAGKSTFFQQRFFNMDVLMTRNRERVLLAACLEAKQPFVIDNTNLTRHGRAGYISQAKAAGFGVAGYYFKIHGHLPNSTLGAWREPSSALKNGLSGNVPLMRLARITVGNCCLDVM